METGAGDTSIGYYSAAMYRGISGIDAIIQATVAAGICVTRKGAARSIPYLSEVEAALIEVCGTIKPVTLS